MKTLLIHGDDPERTGAWASYLAKHGFAVFTSSDALEAADILRTVKVESVVLSTNDQGAYLLLGKSLRLMKKPARVVVVTRIRNSMLEILLESEEFTRLEEPFTFNTLKHLVSVPHESKEELQHVFV